MKLLNSSRGLPLPILATVLVLLACVPGHAQRGGRGGAAPAAGAPAAPAAGQAAPAGRGGGGAQGGRGGGGGGGRQNAPIDLTGYWVSVISEDWEFRMVTPDKGIFDTLTLNNEGRRVGQTWDPAKDEAAGEQCRAYGAANIMRMPTRLHVTWENDTTLRMDTDAGTQTRLLHFGTPAPAGTTPSWQGYSSAEW